MSLLADVLTVALGLAIALTILGAGVGRMVLLIPAAVKSLIERGRVAGVEQGIAQGIAQGMEQGIAQGAEQEREAQRQRRKEAYARFGIELDGARVLSNTPEVEDFLSGKSGGPS